MKSPEEIKEQTEKEAEINEAEIKEAEIREAEISDPNRMRRLNEIAIASGEVAPKNRLENQMRLATQMYMRQNADVDLSSHEVRNEIMFAWSAGGEESLSKIYKDVENDSAFATHPRLAGNTLNIDLDDVLYYKQNGKLPA